MTDVIIPLGNGSSNGNEELRVLLRSMDRHLMDCGRVIVATSCPPDWLGGDAVVYPIGDLYTDNKDANLHRKILAVLEGMGVGDFVFCADDNCFMQDISADAIPVIHNHRENGLFYQKDAGRWKKRVRNTLDWAARRGAVLEHNFECHCPQRFDGGLLRERLRDLDFVSQPGLTIYTAWRVLTETYRDSHDQREYKQTFELEMDERPRTMTDEELHSKAFIGYSDAGVRAGILDRLKGIFTEKSRYER